MATAKTTTVSHGTSGGLAEDFEDMIFNVSPTDTPMLSLAKRKTATGRYHQWQEDSLAAASSNKAEEGADASYATHTAPTTLGNYCQISTKSVNISALWISFASMAASLKSPMRCLSVARN